MVGEVGLDIVTSGASEATVGTVVSNLTEGVKGVYGLAAEGFNFIANNPLCMVMVALSFAGAGLGLVGRAFKTSRR